MRFTFFAVSCLLIACSSETTQPAETQPAAGGGGGVVTAGGGGMGGTPEPTACELLELDLQTALDATHSASGAPGGAVLGVLTPDCGQWLGATGESTDGVPMSTEAILRVGSVTKTYVSATLIRLASDGALSLDDPIETFVAGIPDGDLITVRMLLNHTSGIFNYTGDAAFMNQVVSDPNVAYTPQQIVDAAIAHPPTFAPGAGWAYSNTNYTLAGMVIEAVTQSAAGTVIRNTMLAPANLQTTALDGEEPIPGTLAKGFGPGGSDYTNLLHPSVPWTAGSMVASIGDVVDWARQLYGGDLLTPVELAELTTTVDAGGVGYGLGVLVYPQSLLGGVSEGMGHGGAIPGFYTDMLYVVDEGTVIATIINSEGAVTNDYMLAALTVLYFDQR
jgi:D-alanyl-D-alanine carboxypeptidase